MHHLTHPPPRVCLAGFSLGILGKDSHNKSLQIRLVCKATVVLRQASPGIALWDLGTEGAPVGKPVPVIWSKLEDRGHQSHVLPIVLSLRLASRHLVRGWPPSLPLSSEV